MDYKNYKLTIQVLELYKNLVSDLDETLRKQVPANIELSVDIFQTEEMQNLCVAGIVHQADIIEIN